MNLHFLVVVSQRFPDILPLWTRIKVIDTLFWSKFCNHIVPAPASPLLFSNHWKRQAPSLARIGTLWFGLLGWASRAGPRPEDRDVRGVVRNGAFWSMLLTISDRGGKKDQNFGHLWTIKLLGWSLIWLSIAGLSYEQLSRSRRSKRSVGRSGRSWASRRSMAGWLMSNNRFDSMQ